MYSSLAFAVFGIIFAPQTGLARQAAAPDFAKAVSCLIETQKPGNSLAKFSAKSVGLNESGIVLVGTEGPYFCATTGKETSALKLALKSHQPVYVQYEGEKLVDANPGAAQTVSCKMRKTPQMEEAVKTAVTHKIESLVAARGSREERLSRLALCRGIAGTGDSYEEALGSLTAGKASAGPADSNENSGSGSASP